jgi:hypothetical protein
VTQDEAVKRARRLDAMDGLLPALFEALDVREVFARISAIAKEALPHDAVGLPLVTEDREHIVPYASIGLGHAVTFDIMRIPDYVRTRFSEAGDYVAAPAMMPPGRRLSPHCRQRRCLRPFRHRLPRQSAISAPWNVR